MASRFLSRNINCLFLVGEVVDRGFSPYRKQYGMRLRLKIRPSYENGRCMYVDIYGRADVAKQMNVTGTIGSIVYCECSLSNERVNSITRRTYIKCHLIDCLYRETKVKKPNCDKIVNLIDNLDPDGYLEDTFEEDEEGNEKDG